MKKWSIVLVWKSGQKSLWDWITKGIHRFLTNMRGRRSQQQAIVRLRDLSEGYVTKERSSFSEASDVLVRMTGRKGYEEGFSPRLAFLTEPSSYTSEQYRKLRTMLFSLSDKNNYKTFVISSAGVQDGKTITSINLALAMASNIDKKIILIDGDLRKPSVHTYLGMDMRPGLVDLLRDSAPLNLSAVRPFKNLSVLTCGEIPDNPTELLNSMKMRQLLEIIKANYDIVLIDSVPLLPIADTMIISEMCDGMVLVVRADKTEYSVLEKAIPLIGDKIIGTVLNGVPLNKIKQNNYYTYYTNSSYTEVKAGRK